MVTNEGKEFIYYSSLDAVRGYRFNNILYYGTWRKRDDVDVDQLYSMLLSN
jgi:hypothetical protein